MSAVKPQHQQQQCTFPRAGIVFLLSQVRRWVSVLLNPPWLHWKKLKTKTLLQNKPPQRDREPAFPTKLTHFQLPGLDGTISQQHVSQCMCRVCRRKVIKSHTDTYTYNICKPEQAKMKDDQEKNKNKCFSESLSTLLFSLLKPKMCEKVFSVLTQRYANVQVWQKKHWRLWRKTSIWSLHTIQHFLYSTDHGRAHEHHAAAEAISHIISGILNISHNLVPSIFYDTYGKCQQMINFIMLSLCSSCMIKVWLSLAIIISCPLIVPLTRYVRACKCLWGDSDAKTKKNKKNKTGVISIHLFTVISHILTNPFCKPCKGLKGNRKQKWIICVVRWSKASLLFYLPHAEKFTLGKQQYVWKVSCVYNCITATRVLKNICL